MPIHMPLNARNYARYHINSLQYRAKQLLLRRIKKQTLLKILRSFLEHEIFFLLIQDLLCILRRSYSNILHYRSCLISIKENLKKKKKKKNLPKLHKKWPIVFQQSPNTCISYLCIVGEVLQRSVISAICQPEGAALPLSLLSVTAPTLQG